jgi:hypothetical protein
VRFAAGDHHLIDVAFARAEPLREAVAACVERHLRERARAKRRDPRVVVPESGWILLGADDGHVDFARETTEEDAVLEHALGVVDRRHEPGLVVDEDERAASGVERVGRRMHGHDWLEWSHIPDRAGT